MRMKEIFEEAKWVLRKYGFYGFFRKLVRNYITSHLLISEARRKVDELSRDTEKKNLMSFAFSTCDQIISPMQVKSEIGRMLKIVGEEKPKTILEIGTAKGGTLFLLCRVAASKDAKIISVDLPGGEYGGGYPQKKVPLYKSFALTSQKLHLVRGNSHLKKTLEKVRETLRGRKIDFIFIDGDHTYEGVKRDFNLYGPLLRKGGLIGFHDIAKHPRWRKVDVDLFWKEVKEKYDTSWELIEDKNQEWAGIGLVKID
jgi:predicted O-methyltransferase YrrM